jgi:homoserine O-succinyltransferase
MILLPLRPSASGLIDSTNVVDGAGALHIALLNNMPDGALEATERQYLELLTAAAGDLPVRLSLFSLSQVPRGEWGRSQIARRYSGVDELWSSDVDGLIVTGAEPRAANLSDEPYWESLTEVIDWAREETNSAVWSCLAAHAALQHLDGIRRLPLPAKQFGVFPCALQSEHALTAGLPASFSIPHSRWNGVSSAAIEESGSHLLTRLEDGGADIWIREQGSLFVFLQGHPEYDANTLELEYRRDIARFLRGERRTYPDMPAHYFAPETRQYLADLQSEILAGNAPAELPSRFGRTEHPRPWRAVAIRFYSNWLHTLREKRTGNGRSRGRYLCAASGAGD